MVLVIILFPLVAMPRDGLSGTLKLEGCRFGRCVGRHKKADFGNPCDLSHSESEPRERSFACVTPIITLARCVPFRRIAEGTAVMLTQRSLFPAKPSTFAPGHARQQHRRSPACPIVHRCRTLIPWPRLPLPLISQLLPQQPGKASPVCAVRTRLAASPRTGSETAG